MKQISTKYPMKSKKEHPRFKYMVRPINSMDYYLFSNFNDALDKLKALSLQKIDKIICLYEPFFNTENREWYVQNTFTAINGEIDYDKHAKIDLHLFYYIQAGEWLNPDIRLLD